MRRNFGLGHLNPKTVCQRLQHSLSKRAAKPAPVVSVSVFYRGVGVFVVHNWNAYSTPLVKNALLRGEN